MLGGRLARHLFSKGNRLLAAHVLVATRFAMESPVRCIHSTYRRLSSDAGRIFPLSPESCMLPRRNPGAAVNNTAPPRAKGVCRSDHNDRSLTGTSRMVHTSVPAPWSRHRPSSLSVHMEGYSAFPSPAQSPSEYTQLPREYYDSLSPALQTTLLDSGFAAMVRQTILSRYSKTKLSRWALSFNRKSSNQYPFEASFCNDEVTR
eukprot:9485601-Pyramimonas_sp.AAC.1